MVGVWVKGRWKSGSLVRVFCSVLLGSALSHPWRFTQSLALRNSQDCLPAVSGNSLHHAGRAWAGEGLPTITAPPCSPQTV